MIVSVTNKCMCFISAEKQSSRWILNKQIPFKKTQLFICMDLYLQCTFILSRFPSPVPHSSVEFQLTELPPILSVHRSAVQLFQNQASSWELKAPSNLYLIGIHGGDRINESWHNNTNHMTYGCVCDNGTLVRKAGVYIVTHFIMFSLL